MNDRESKPNLDELLKRWKLPVQSQVNTEHFVRSVRVALQRHTTAATREKTHSMSILAWGPALGFALLILASLVFSVNREANRSRVANPADTSSNIEALELWQGVKQLFPERLAAIELHNDDTNLKLSDTPVSEDATPLFIQVCKAGQCRSFLTISGQEINAFGRQFDVMEESNGAILVVSDQSAWSSADPTGHPGGVAITARLLNAREL